MAARGKVLVVEDDDDLSSLIESVLTDQGYEVLVARNGQQALDAVAEVMPRLILLDIRMPIMDGLQFATEFHRRYGHVAGIVVMTASEDAELRAQEAQADGWLGKPFDLDKLCASVERYVGPQE
jgi:DNA-binding response OmpR family regulator